MTPERWEQITEIYNSAQELEKGEQKAFLEKACADDESLLREVKSLIAADGKAGSFIAENAVKDSPSLLTIKDFSTLSGQTLGQFQIISHIGSGGMGEVYLAKDLRLNRHIALKALPISLSGNRTYLMRFQTEAKAAATLNHPNVATIYSVEEIDGQPFFTMEYVKGKTLNMLIPDGGLSLKLFLEWFVDLADALSHAHEKGIVHRDIKPGNIIVTPAGVPKILDFGLAQIDTKKVTHESSTLSLTQPGQILGTPSYMSPEQAEGEKIDSRSDIFSFGIVMYEAITGERPFKGESYAAIVSELLTKEPPPISDVKPDTPFLLSRLIMRCLHKSASQRFQTMQEVRVILEEIKAAVEAGNTIVSSPPDLFPEKSGSLQKRIFIPLLLLVFLTAGFGIYFFTREIPKPPISFENLTLRKLSQTNNVVYAHISPDGKSVAYNTIEDNEERSLWIRGVEDKNALQLLPPQSVFFWGGLTISKNGSQIYYITAERSANHGTLYKVSSLGGAPRKLVEKVNDLGSLSPDGERVLYVRYGETMQLLSANASDGSDERLILSTDSRQIYRDPQFSVEGDKIFFIKFELIKGEEHWSLVEISANGGEERVIIPFRKPKINEIAVLKDKSGLLINAVDPVSNLPQIYYVSVSDGKETRITNDLNAYFGISVSDDVKTVVTAQRLSANNISIFENGETIQEKKLSKEDNIYSTAVFTPDGKIVYDAEDNNRPHIWIMNADGSNPQQLTPNDSTDFYPFVTPDGRFIIFLSERTGERKIWRMNIDGSNPQNLTPVDGRIFSHNFISYNQTVLFHWNKAEKKAMGEVPLMGGEIKEFSLFSDDLTAVSPDGKQVAYVFFNEQDRKRKVRVHALENEEVSTIFNISPIKFLKWTADGKGLLYREIETDNESVSTVWLQPISGGDPKPFLSVKPDAVLNVSQSKDGNQTAVVRGNLLTDAVMLTKVEPD